MHLTLKGKIMNKFNFFYKTIIVGFLILFTSCNNYLDVPPVTQVTSETFYNTDNQLHQAIVAAYSSLGNRGLYGWSYSLMRSVLDDDARTIETTDILRHEQFNIPATDPFIKNMWGAIYEGVYRCNIVIDKAPKASNASEEVIKNVLGEARFLRALYYWHLVTMWGEVPIITDIQVSSKGVVKSSVSDVWKLITDDLTLVISDKMLPEKWPASGTGRATIGAAKALLGKCYLYQKDYQKASAMFTDVITSPLYSLDSVEKVWTIGAENDGENIFEVQFSKIGDNPFYDDGGTAAEGTLRNVYIGAPQGGGWGNLYADSVLVTSFLPGDKRLKAYIFTAGDTFPWDNTVTMDPTKNKIGSNGLGVIRKGMNSGVGSFWPGGFNENTPLIRYTDVLLMQAECKTNLGDDAGAKVEIDKVRKRSFNNDSTYISIDSLMKVKSFTTVMDVIKYERRIELCFEMHRFNDLVRWGDALTVLGPIGFTAKATYYPIPQDDITRSGGSLKQTSGY